MMQNYRYLSGRYIKDVTGYITYVTYRYEILVTGVIIKVNS